MFLQIEDKPFVSLWNLNITFNFAKPIFNIFILPIVQLSFAVICPTILASIIAVRTITDIKIVFITEKRRKKKNNMSNKNFH